MNHGSAIAREGRQGEALPKGGVMAGDPFLDALADLVVAKLRPTLAEMLSGVRAAPPALDPNEELSVSKYAAEHHLTPAAIYKQVSLGQLDCRHCGRNGRTIKIKRGAVCR